MDRVERDRSVAPVDEDKLIDEAPWWVWLLLIVFAWSLMLIVGGVVWTAAKLLGAW